MERDQIIIKNKYKSNKKAVASLVLGIINLVIPSYLLLFFHIGAVAVGNKLIDFIFGLLEMILIFGLGFVFIIIGMILGILGLKSEKRKLSITGIILSLISLGGNIYIYMMFLKMGWA